MATFEKNSKSTRPNDEPFPSFSMCCNLSLVERKVAEFYHNIDRRHHLVWSKKTNFITIWRQLMVSLYQGHNQVCDDKLQKSVIERPYEFANILSFEIVFQYKVFICKHGFAFLGGPYHSLAVHICVPLFG